MEQAVSDRFPSSAGSWTWIAEESGTMAWTPVPSTTLAPHSPHIPGSGSASSGSIASPTALFYLAVTAEAGSARRTSRTFRRVRNLRSGVNRPTTMR